MDYLKKNERRTPRCLECGDKISYGRHDKKFCCEDCKNRHHNHNARASRTFRRKVLSMLAKNYGILDGLVRSGIDAIWLDDILLLGFSPAYATSFRKKGSRWEYSCFDIRYELSPKRMTSISKVSMLLQGDESEDNDGYMKMFP